MRIGIISTMTGVPWGGSEPLWFETAKVALSEGHHLLVSAAKWDVIDPHFTELERLGAQVHFRRRIEYSPRLIHRIGRRIRRTLDFWGDTPFRHVDEFAPDVLLISQGDAYDVALNADLRTFLINTSTPFVLINQSNRDLRSFEEDSRSVVKSLYRKAAKIGFVAHSNLKQAERHIAESIPNATVVRNPVNLQDTAEVKCDWSQDTVKFAAVGRLSIHSKGQDILFESLSGEEWSQRKWQLDLFGDGVDRVYLEDLAAHFGISERVRFMGHVSEIKNIWADHQILLFPSRHEGTPLVLVEAMLCGRTAVVTDVGGISEWIKDECNGFVAKAATPRCFAETLERAWHNRDKWEELGRAARSTALAQFEPNPGLAILRVLCDCSKNSH